jgi:hypothetical protein
MKAKRSSPAALGLAVTTASTTAYAHSFVEPYVLPVPFWLYVYACAATLIVTFAILGYFVRASAGFRPSRVWSIPSGKWPAIGGRYALWLLRGAALACLICTIVAGFIGTGDPLQNIAMPLFWMIFLLAFTYATAVIGNLYELINPWLTIVRCIERVAPRFSHDRVRYPQRLGYYPAFVFYVALVWIELFVLPKPIILATALALYTAMTFVGVFLFGQRNWFQYCDLFAVFFRLVALLAPVEYVPALSSDRWRVLLRAPIRSAADARIEHLGLVLFILFMLSSTTYDAIHETDLWVGLYWHRLIVLAQPLWGTDMVKAQHVLTPWYDIYQRAGLLLLPFVYLALYAVMLAWAKRLTKASLSLHRLVLDFAPSLIPIAIVYNATHYYTMLISQLGRIAIVATDPLGLGWNLFAVGVRETPPPLDMALIWHTQVALILIGHLASVYLAHVAATRVFSTRRQAVLSQIPLLLLMVAYTAIGLYILSLPLASPMYVE